MDNLLYLASNLSIANLSEEEAPGVEVFQRAHKKRPRTRSKRSDPYKFLLCLDFEATCWKREEQAKWKELIEFPAILVDMETGEMLAEFREYLKPTEFPTLTDFCVGLTNIEQATVNSGISINRCLAEFDVWLKQLIKQHDLRLPKMTPNDPGNVALSTWTNWDPITLSKECARKKIKKPSYYNQWIDVKEIFTRHYKHKPKSFDLAIQYTGLTFEGQPHSGLDDAKNLARLAHKMRKDGARFFITKDNNPHQALNPPF